MEGIGRRVTKTVRHRPKLPVLKTNQMSTNGAFRFRCKHFFLDASNQWLQMIGNAAKNSHHISDWNKSEKGNLREEATSKENDKSNKNIETKANKNSNEKRGQRQVQGKAGKITFSTIIVASR